MTSIDIVKIIKACKETGIERVEYQDLLLVFKSEMPQDTVTWNTVTPNTMNLVDNDAEMTHNENTEEDEEDELIKLSDPLEWERRQVNG